MVSHTSWNLSGLSAERDCDPKRSTKDRSERERVCEREGEDTCITRWTQGDKIEIVRIGVVSRAALVSILGAGAPLQGVGGRRPHRGVVVRVFVHGDVVPVAKFHTFVHSRIISVSSS